MVRLVLICGRIPPPLHNGAKTEFGLQDVERALHPGKQQADGSIRFETTVSCTRSHETGVKFASPFIHGPSAERFLYLGWRPSNGPGDGWITRWKIPLSGITWQMVLAAESTGAGVMGRISGAGSGTVPLLDEGWMTTSAPPPSGQD